MKIQFVFNTSSIKHLCMTLFSITFVTISATAAEIPQDSDYAVGQSTYDETTIVGAATDALGSGAEGLAKTIENLFKKYGQPNAYISGSEAGGGLIIGLRYGGGTLSHKIEGESPIHWTGPSIGFDAGADAVKTFALVYNLYDGEEIYRRIGALEGSAYYIGGLGVSAYSNKTIRIAMIRIGVGLRAQASIGYMKFTKKRSFLPF